MAVRTVDDSRIQAVVRRIAELDAAPARREAVALGLVDAVLAGDDQALGATLDALRDARARTTGDRELSGWLDAAIAFAHWGLERVPASPAVAEGTQAHDFLRVLDGSARLGSTELRRLLETDETQVSRTGRRLLESGLVTRRRVGRQAFWQLTPRGRRALEDTPAPKRSPNSAFWQEAIRRGFEAASGDEPGEPREVDPIRERIVERTLELHVSRGIRATTFSEVAEAPAPKRSSNSEFWRAALRRGFEAASGDMPGEPREVDPAREHIIQCTLALHLDQGIQATTWTDIADKSGVPEETVKQLFPTQDELTRSCGAHFMETLQLPPADRAPEIFAGASSETERIRRLVETSFGVYERGADGIALGRRERKQVAAADESIAEIDNSLDALVAEALRPLSPEPSSVASVRALTDLEVWRTLRDQGATSGAAVDRASSAVERWLEAQPSRG